METFISAPLALVIVGAISVMLLSFGFFVGKKVSKSSNDFLYAGRNVGLALSTATLLAAWITSNTTMSAPEQGYTIGIISCFGYATAGLSLCIFAPLALRIKKIMPNGCTSGDFVRRRYGKAVWIVFLLISAWYFTGFLMTQAMGGGILLQALSGVDYHVGLVLIRTVCTIYTIKGGFKAILSTDFIMAMLILVMLLVTAVLAFVKFSPADVHTGVMAAKPELMNVISGVGIMYLGTNFLFASGEIFHSNIWWQRIYAAKEKVTFRSFILSGIIWTTVPIIAGSLAFIAVANGYVVPQVNMVFPIVVSKLLGPLGAVLVLIIIYSALASTVSSVLTASANLLVQDIYHRAFRPQASDEQVVKYVRYTMAAMAAITVLLVWNQPASMYQVLYLTGSGVAATIWPIAFGVYNKHVNRKVVLAAMLLSVGCGLIAYFTVHSYAAPVTSALIGMVVIGVGSKIAPDNDFKWSTLNAQVTEAIGKK